MQEKAAHIVYGSWYSGFTSLLRRHLTVDWISVDLIKVIGGDCFEHSIEALLVQTGVFDAERDSHLLLKVIKVVEKVVYKGMVVSA